MKVKRTKTIIEVTQKELNALDTVIELLKDLEGDEEICESFEDCFFYALVEGLNDIIDFFDYEKQKNFIIQVVNKEEN